MTVKFVELKLRGKLPKLFTLAIDINLSKKALHSTRSSSGNLSPREKRIQRAGRKRSWPALLGYFDGEGDFSARPFRRGRFGAADSALRLFGAADSAPRPFGAETIRRRDDSALADSALADSATGRFGAGRFGAGRFGAGRFGAGTFRRNFIFLLQ